MMIRRHNKLENNVCVCQAVDRAYRIGQRKDVVVYRLITCGTVEEKIYRKQVFKGGLMRTLGKEAKQFRYFTCEWNRKRHMKLVL